jgi:SH3 domain protein
MKSFGATLFVLLVMAAAALAQPVYINDVVKVTIRNGPGSDHKVLTVMTSGDRVELVEKGKEWSRVRIPAGSEGWIATRMLTEKEPNILKIRRLEEQLAVFQTDDGGPDPLALIEENKQLKNALAEARFELEAAADTKEKASAEARTRVQELENRLSACQARLKDQTLAEGIRWFLAGAGVLLIGLLIGLKFHRRQRSGLL